MNQFTYNVGILAGTALASIGAGLQWGLPVGLMVMGGQIVGLTLLAAFTFGREG